MNNGLNASYQGPAIMQSYAFKRTSRSLVKMYLLRFYTLSIKEHTFNYRKEFISKEIKYTLDTHKITKISTVSSYKGINEYIHPVVVETKKKCMHIFLESQKKQEEWLRAFSAFTYIKMEIPAHPKQVIPQNTNKMTTEVNIVREKPYTDAREMPLQNQNKVISPKRNDFVIKDIDNSEPFSNKKKNVFRTKDSDIITNFEPTVISIAPGSCKESNKENVNLKPSIKKLPRSQTVLAAAISNISSVGTLGDELLNSPEQQAKKASPSTMNFINLVKCDGTKKPLADKSNTQFDYNWDDA